MIYKKRTFEDYLKEYHSKLYSEILDDDLPDHFENWLGELEIDNLITYANLFGEEQHIAGQDKALKSVKN